jgi:hypothetical protein
LTVGALLALISQVAVASGGADVPVFLRARAAHNGSGFVFPVVVMVA